MSVGVFPNDTAAHLIAAVLADEHDERGYGRPAWDALVTSSHSLRRGWGLPGRSAPRRRRQ